MRRAVIDTDLVLEGLTLRGESGRVMEAWRDRRFLPCVSTSLALEYEEVSLRRFRSGQHDGVRAALQALLERAGYVPSFFNLRPSAPDPDDYLLECAFNAHATLVSRDDRDLLRPCLALQIDYIGPGAFLDQLADRE